MPELRMGHQAHASGAAKKKQIPSDKSERGIKKELETKLHYCGCILLERWKSSGITKGRLWTEAVGVRWSRDQSAAHAAKVRDRPVGCLRPASWARRSLQAVAPHYLSARSAPAPHTHKLYQKYIREIRLIWEKNIELFWNSSRSLTPQARMFMHSRCCSSYLHHRANSHLFGANLYKLCCSCRPEWMYDCVYLDARGAWCAACWFDSLVCAFDDVQLSSACAVFEWDVITVMCRSCASKSATKNRLRSNLALADALFSAYINVNPQW